MRRPKLCHLCPGSAKELAWPFRQTQLGPLLGSGLLSKVQNALAILAANPLFANNPACLADFVKTMVGQQGQTPPSVAEALAAAPAGAKSVGSQQPAPLQPAAASPGAPPEATDIPMDGSGVPAQHEQQVEASKKAPGSKKPAGEGEALPKLSPQEVEANKKFWSKYKTAAGDSPKPDEQTAGGRGTDATVESQTQVESQTLPETQKVVVNVDTVDTQTTQAMTQSPVALSEMGPVSAEPELPDNQLGLEDPTDDAKPNKSKSDVAEALCRLSTVDLQDGTRPPQSLVAPETGTHTAVLMSLGGVLQPVTVPLTVKQCQEAGLTLANQPVQHAPPPVEPVQPPPAPSATPNEVVEECGSSKEAKNLYMRFKRSQSRH